MTARPRRLFITGTDTDAGKTVAACALLHAAREAGLRTVAIKPVAAGCEERAGRWVNDDALRLAAAATAELPYEQVNPIALPPPIAPHIAAGQLGVALSAVALARHCAAVEADETCDWMLVEGAGGWWVPLGEGETLADLASLLEAQVVLVVGLKLGCINHALLTAAAIEGAGLPLVGWIASAVDPTMAEAAENIRTLEQRLTAPCLGVIPYLDPCDPEVAARYLRVKSLFEAVT